MKLPQARNENLVVQQLEKETLIYDLNTNKILVLNDTSDKVFSACGSKQTFDELKSQHRLTDEIIYLALDELKKHNLLESAYSSPLSGMNRREAVRRIGLASLIALPVISSFIAPTAINAQSCRAARQPGSFTVNGSTDQEICEVVGFADPACCSGISRGTFVAGTTTCTGILCT